MGQAWTRTHQHVDRWIEHPREDAHRRCAALFHLSHRGFHCARAQVAARPHRGRRWILTDNGNGTTSIEWVYVLVPLSPQAMTQVEQSLLKRYQVRLESALTIIKDDLEKD